MENHFHTMVKKMNGCSRSYQEVLCYKERFELQCRKSVSIPPALKDMVCASTQETIDHLGYRGDYREVGSVTDAAYNLIPFQMGQDHQTQII